MDLYVKLIDVIAPVFFVIGIGYYLGKKNPEISTDFITTFAGNVGTPAMIFYTMAQLRMKHAIETVCENICFLQHLNMSFLHSFFQ